MAQDTTNEAGPPVVERKEDGWRDTTNIPTDTSNNTTRPSRARAWRTRNKLSPDRSDKNSAFRRGLRDYEAGQEMHKDSSSGPRSSPRTARTPRIAGTKHYILEPGTERWKAVGRDAVLTFVVTTTSRWTSSTAHRSRTCS